MEKIEITETRNSPRVICDPDEGLIKLEGRCILENSHEFFQPIKAWLDEYIANNDALKMEVFVDYFNTSTSFVILNIFKGLSELRSTKNINVTWFYQDDDPDMKEAGEEYNLILNDLLDIQVRNEEEDS